MKRGLVLLLILLIGCIGQQPQRPEPEVNVTQLQIDLWNCRSQHGKLQEDYDTLEGDFNLTVRTYLELRGKYDNLTAVCNVTE